MIRFSKLQNVPSIGVNESATALKRVVDDFLLESLGRPAIPFDASA
jgi:hypothetical protein